MKIFRHGDVLIRQIDAMPTGLQKKKDKVLAWGEATGRNHTLVVPELADFHIRIDVTSNKIYFSTDQAVELEHQEHKTIEIDPGIYTIDIERERDPFTNMILRVKD
jgi:hypothetical protein